MNKVFFSSILAGVLLVVGSAQAKPIPAKLTVGKKVWTGQVLSIKGDLLNFKPNTMSGTVSYPLDAIKELTFPIKLDAKTVSDLIDKRLYDQVIPMLSDAIAPYEAYSNLPTNLAKYEGILMELYYKAGDYEKSLKFSSKLINDDRDPELQRNSWIYQGLALIAEERFDEAQKLFAEKGWTEKLGDDAPAQDLYITAKFMAMKGEYTKALEMAAKVVAFDSQDPDWVRPAELLCAQMYTQLGFLDSADEVIREITLLYKNSDEAVQAQKLKVRVDRLRARQDKSDRK